MMAENSAIEWTEHTFNPWIGCAMVAPECTNCYAKTLMDDRYGKAKWGPKGTRVVTAAANWAKVKKWDRDAAKAGMPARVFCCSLADVFEDDRECTGGEDRDLITLGGVRSNLWELIEATPNLIWLLLTKRPENILDMVPMAWTIGGRWPSNVWTGTSAGCQATADAAIPHLLKVPGKHFLSCEPMLGAVDLGDCLRARKTIHLGMSVSGAIRNKAFTCFNDEGGKPVSRKQAERELRELEAKGVKVIPVGECSNFDPTEGCLGHPQPRIDWVICGGESGPHARPMHPDWARGLRDQCAAAGVPFFFKQWGEWVTGEATTESGTAYMSCATGEVLCSKSSPQRENFGTDPDKHSGHLCALRVGKAAAGRLLDGRTHDDLPVEFTAPLTVAP